jgi:hypothetical protein
MTGLYAGWSQSRHASAPRGSAAPGEHGLDALALAFEAGTRNSNFSVAALHIDPADDCSRTEQFIRSTDQSPCIRRTDTKAASAGPGNRALIMII